MNPMDEPRRAIEAALRAGSALLKTVSPNDTGQTGSHQAGFLLPRSHWRFFSPYPPKKGSNHKHEIEIVWPDGRRTMSVVTWYGRGTRSEFRLTRFGKGFAFRNENLIGGILVLVAEEPLRSYRAYFVIADESIEELQAALGLELVGSSAFYDSSSPHPPESSDACIARACREVAAGFTSFPTTGEMAQEASRILDICSPQLRRAMIDQRLMRCIETEYDLFRRIEENIHSEEIRAGFTSLDTFLKTAQTILQRRKARAGKSLEHHVFSVLKEHQLPFEAQARVNGSSVDFLFPDTAHYEDTSYPRDKVLALAVKTTCKDRWRQVALEASKVGKKFLLTLQRGISEAQVSEILGAGINLIVPHELHADYPKPTRRRLLTVNGFIELAISMLMAG